MRYTIQALAIVAVLAAAGPASAQIVNGNSGADNTGSAPIGTKGGGSAAAMQAPGETAVAAGAQRNDQDFKNSPGASPRSKRVKLKNTMPQDAPAPNTTGN